MANLHEELIQLINIYDKYTGNIFRKILFAFTNVEDKKLEQEAIDFIQKNGTKRNIVIDNRTPVEYLTNVFIEWLNEEFIALYCSKHINKFSLKSLKIEVNKRDIVRIKPYTYGYTPDLAIVDKTNGESIAFIEVITNWGKKGETFWEKNGFFDLREKKYDSIVEKVKDGYIIFLIFYAPEQNKISYLSASSLLKANAKPTKIDEFGGKYGIRLFFKDILEQNILSNNFSDFLKFISSEIENKLYV